MTRTKKMLHILVKSALKNSQSLTLHLRAITAQNERMVILHDRIELLEKRGQDMNKVSKRQKITMDWETDRAYYWLATHHPPGVLASVRGRALGTLRLRILKQSSFDEIVDELGGSIGEHAARCAWAREMHKRAKISKRQAYLDNPASASPDQPHASLLQNRAHAAVAKAIKCRELLPPEHCRCALCKVAAQEYHHDDYNRPLDVTPLCKSCHRQHHAKLRSET